MCHHKHLSNLQLGCKELRRHENANDKKTHKNKEAAEKVEEETEKKKSKEKPKELWDWYSGNISQDREIQRNFLPNSHRMGSQQPRA